MAPVSDSQRAVEAVERVRRKLHMYMDQAAGALEDVPTQTRNAFSLATYIVRVRRQLARATQSLREGDEPSRERVIRQAEIAYFTYPERFSNVSSRSELLREWTKLLVEATEKVASEDALRDQYAAVGAEEGARGTSSVTQASSESLRRWQ